MPLSFCVCVWLSVLFCVALLVTAIRAAYPPPITWIYRLSDLLFLCLSHHKNYINYFFRLLCHSSPFTLQFLHKNRVEYNKVRKCLLSAVFVLTAIWRSGGCRLARPSLLCLQEETLEHFILKFGRPDGHTLTCACTRNQGSVNIMRHGGNYMYHVL